MWFLLDFWAACDHITKTGAGHWVQMGSELGHVISNICVRGFLLLLLLVLVQLLPQLNICGRHCKFNADVGDLAAF